MTILTISVVISQYSTTIMTISSWYINYNFFIKISYNGVINTNHHYIVFSL